MDRSAIIKQAKHYFGKNRSFKKELLLSYKLNNKFSRKWITELDPIIKHPFTTRFNIFTDVISNINAGTVEEIDWKWTGDFSFTIEILLNEGIKSGYDWYKNLATKCNGNARVLTLHISEVIPCYTYYCHYTTYSKAENYVGYGPITKFTQKETAIIKDINALLRKKGYELLNKAFTEKKVGGLYSDLSKDGTASLFDVLFADDRFYVTDIKKCSDKAIVEKNGAEFRWEEYYNNNGTLKERTEYRTTKLGDYVGICFNGKGEITNVYVTRKKIGRDRHKLFELDIEKEYQKKKKEIARKQKSR